LLAKFKSYPATTIVFESPRRVVEALEDVLAVLGDRPSVLARELTKMHEEFLRGRCSEVLAALKTRPAIQGEITLLIGPETEEEALPACKQTLKERVQELMRDQKLNRMEALKVVARERHLSKSGAYREFES
jgi:16S rRNA (cytidine1402-2'-O)-methyltransferase